MDAESGQMLSHYRLVEKIGEGGMGVVWRAEDTVLNRLVAIKVLPHDLALNEERRRMFLEEARLAASVSHGNIVQVHEVGRERDLEFIVMEHVEGEPLNKLLHGRPLPPDKVVELGIQVARGLARAHRKKLIHRDLKPANLIVTPDGDVKIVDFGLATLFERGDDPTSLASTATGAPTDRGEKSIAGTLPYMSPEQVRGDQLDSRSDIFSFGSVLYEMTSGERPFTGARPPDVAKEILTSAPRPLRELVPQVPLDLHRIIEKALARRPADRYQHADDLVVDLKRLGKELESGSSPSFEDLRPTVVPRKRWLASLTMVLALALGITSWVLRAGRNAGDQVTAGTEVDLGSGGPQNWILVTEFQGPTGDRDLANAARELIVASLSYSDVVTPISRTQMKRGLQLALKPDTTRVFGDIARELAVRASADRYVEGRVDRLLTSYSVVLNVIETGTGELAFSVHGAVENDEIFISTLEALGQQLRQRLGESASRPRRDFGEVITPSLEAYSRFLEGRQLFDARDYANSRRVLRQALADDPDFALAWESIGTSFRNEGFMDSARAAWDEALKRPDRLTNAQLRKIEAEYAAEIQHDYERAVAIYRQMLRQDITSSLRASVLHSLSICLGRLGRREESFEALSAAGEASPFGPDQTILSNQFTVLRSTGRLDEARDVADRLEGRSGRIARMRIAFARAEWARAESLSADLKTDPAASPGNRLWADLQIASAHAARGAVRQAARIQERAAVDPPRSTDGQFACLARRLLASTGACAATDSIPSAIQDTLATSFLMLGYLEAIYGQTEAARTQLQQLMQKPEKQLRLYTVDAEVVQAWIAASEGDWERTIKLAEPYVGEKARYPWCGRLPVRWLVSEAHSQLGNDEKAAECLKLVVNVVGTDESDNTILRGVLFPFVHHRLVLLYAKLGRVEDARRHWEIFEKTFTNPDLELMPMLEGARRALEEAEAKAAS